MNKNILIIAAAAVVAFLAVLLIPRLLDRDTDEDPTSTVSSDSGSQQTETAGSSSEDDKDEPQPANNARAANPGLEAGLAEAVRQINTQVPITIDELTTVTAARLQGRRIQYRYEISTEFSAAQIAQFRQFALTQNQQSICGTSETRQLIELGGEIEYAYYGPGDRYLFSTPITSC